MGNARPRSEPAMERARAATASMTSELIQAALQVRQAATDGTPADLQAAINEVRTLTNAVERTLPVDEPPISERLVTDATLLHKAIEGRRTDVARKRLQRLLDDAREIEAELYRPHAEAGAT